MAGEPLPQFIHCSECGHRFRPGEGDYGYVCPKCHQGQRKHYPACSATKGDGTPCKATPQGNGLCFFHDPSKAKERSEARVAGGLERQRVEPLAKVTEENEPDRELSTRAHVVSLMRITIGRMHRGEVSHLIAGTTAQCASVALKAMDEGDADKRLKELEERTRPLEGLTAEQLMAIVERGKARGVDLEADAEH